MDCSTPKTRIAPLCQLQKATLVRLKPAKSPKITLSALFHYLTVIRYLNQNALQVLLIQNPKPHLDPCSKRTDLALQTKL